MSDCVECGSGENVVNHHTQYDPEETVKVCRSCHMRIHADESHPLYPVNGVPEGFYGDYKARSVRVSEEFHTRVWREKEKDEDYEDTLRRLIDWGDNADDDGPSFGIKP